MSRTTLWIADRNIILLAGPVQIAQLLVIGNPLYYCLCLILLQVLNSYPVGVQHGKGLAYYYIDC